MDLFTLLSILFFFLIQNVSTIIQPTVTSTPFLTPRAPTNKTIYNIGLLFPNVSTLTGRNDMYIRNAVVTSELAIRMAVESVRDKNILPGYIYIFNREDKEKKKTDTTFNHLYRRRTQYHSLLFIRRRIFS